MKHYDYVTPAYSSPEYRTANETGDLLGWGPRILGIETLQAECKGEGARVAVLDTGCAMSHYDLQTAIRFSEDLSSSGTGPADLEGHGTMMAGIIGARENNKGVRGVAPECDLYIAKVMNDEGKGNLDWLTAGIRWAIDRDVHIISMSLTTSSDHPPVHEALIEADKRGIILVASVGNMGPNFGTLGYPAKYPETLAVGSISRRMKVNNFSSRGAQIDVVAPGDQVLSTYPPNTHARSSGTSHAGAMVSGVAALYVGKCLKDGNPEKINNASFKKMVRESAIDIGEAGFDVHSGVGLINPNIILGDNQVRLLLGEDISEEKSKQLEALMGSKERLIFEYGGQEVILEKTHANR